MGINKVNYGETTLIDISSDTVAAGSMLSGVTAHDNSGTAITGTIASKSSSDLTASGATVTVPAGYYSSQASKSVASGTAGTPTATKGTVSNHAISVTPSVTNTAGYISGGTKTGTAVSVSASELVSGNKSITANGTGIDVANYSTVSVSVAGGLKRVTSYRLDPTFKWVEFDIDNSPSEFHLYATASSTSPYTNASSYAPVFELHYDGTNRSGYYYYISSRTYIRAISLSSGEITWTYSSGVLKISLVGSLVFPTTRSGIALYYK